MTTTPQQIVNTGLVANDGTGESLRNAFTAVNNNFANVWAAGPVDSQVVISNNVVSTNVTNLPLVLAGNGIGTVNLNSTTVPSIDSVYDLGSPTKNFDSVYSRYYYGNGRYLTGLSGVATALINGNSYVQITQPDANVTIGVDGVSNTVVFSPYETNFNGNIIASGNITAQNFNGNIFGNISVTGYNTGVVFNDDGLANAVAGLTFDKTANVLTSAGNIVGGNLITSGVNGNITGANVIASTTMCAAGNVYGGNLIISGVNGNITGANVISATTISASSKVIAGAVTYTNIDGANGAVLATYGNGVTHFTTISPGYIAVLTRNSGNIDIPVIQ